MIAEGGTIDRIPSGSHHSNVNIMCSYGVLSTPIAAREAPYALVDSGN